MMDDFNAYLLNGNKRLLDEQCYDSCSHVPFLVKKYEDLSFSHFLHKLLAEPTRATEETKKHVDHIFTIMWSWGHLLFKKRHFLS